MTEQAARALKDTAQQVKETAEEWAERARDSARDAGTATDRYVHEYAWTTVGLVAVTALTIGFLIGRRQD